MGAREHLQGVPVVSMRLIMDQLHFLLRVEKGLKAVIESEQESGVDVVSEEVAAALVYVQQAQYRIGSALEYAR